MGRRGVGMAAALLALVALVWPWPDGGEPPGAPTATEPTASAAPASPGEDADEAGPTGPGEPAATASAPATSDPAPTTSAAPATTSPPPPSSAEPAGDAYGGPLGTRDRTGTEAVALTFDDGPSPEWTPKVLDMLRERGVKAVFCLIGAYAEAHPEIVADIVREGHTLCNHTWFHEFDLGDRGEEEIRANLQRTNDAIARAAPGAAVRYFRHPGGQWTDDAVAVAADLGMESLHWAVDPSDWDESTTEAQIRDRVTDRTGPGAIVLLHDGAANQRDMCGALTSILDEFERRGYAYTPL